MDVVLRTNLSVEECKTRLNEAADLRRFGLTSDKEVRGRIWDNTFRIQKKRLYPGLLGFDPVLGGHIAADPHGGAVIKAYFGTGLGIRLSTIAWITVGWCWLFSTAMFLLGGKTMHPGPLGFIRTMIEIPLAAWFVVKVGRWIGRSDEEFLSEFLRRTLEVEPVVAGRQTS
jgi:hypothetical protein